MQDKWLFCVLQQQTCKTYVFAFFLYNVTLYMIVRGTCKYTNCILSVKKWSPTLPCLPQAKTWSRRRQWHTTPVLLPGKSHGWRSLVGCGPWNRKKLDMTEQLHFHFSLSCTGEGNGNPLQCSCLENPRDGGAWWAAIYGVTQSQTWLKRLSSSSSSSSCLLSQRKILRWL